MVTQSILQRTFYIKHEIFTGTGFTIEKNNKQFLVTTSHTFPFTASGQEIVFSIMHNGKWVEMNSKIYKHPDQLVDMVMIELQSDISPRHPIKLGKEKLLLSQDAFFLGFPYGKRMDDLTSANEGYPLPFVKKGVFSALLYHSGNPKMMYLDGINNPGFSGGPCIYTQPGDHIHTICGVVKGYLPHKIDVKTPLGEYSFNENSGIVEIHSIEHLDEIQIL